MTDIQKAADRLRSVYEATNGADGYVSFEVSPQLAYDTEGTLAEARRLWKQVARPNVMIKVPATSAGIPAVAQLIAEGINVNVTLIFSQSHYEAVAQTYLQGLARCSAPERVASVASVFISRVDTAIDRLLDAHPYPEASALRGHIAIANAKIIYRRFRELFYGDAFQVLRERGARVQRVLWASTGTKDPAYSDVRYVEELIGPDTVNTMPPATLAAFRDHGKVRGHTLTEKLEEAEAKLAQLDAYGISLGEVCERLQEEGVALFQQAFEKLLNVLAEKRAPQTHFHCAATDVALTFHLDAREKKRVASRLAAWKRQQFSCRFWRKDPTLWPAASETAITERMGWLELPEAMHAYLEDIKAFAQKVHSEGMKHVVLLGMGGSSLAPEVFSRVMGSAPDYPELIVLDSTHPAAVRRVEAQIDLHRTLFLVASKSGTTLETLSFFRYFWAKVAALSEKPGDHFVALTDPNTPLEAMAQERGFRCSFSTFPDVGGRYSALSPFGLVPAALLGINIHELLDRAWTAAESSAFCVPVSQNAALRLGAVLGTLALSGRDKLTFVADSPLEAFPDWLEQLLAESLGKQGRGIVPVAHESLGEPEVYGDDRVFVYFRYSKAAAHDAIARKLRALEESGHPVIRTELRDVFDLGQEMFRWEMAVAAAGAVLDVNPFDQPDVELAKELARKAMAADTTEAKTVTTAPANLAEKFSTWLEAVRPGDYLALQAFLPPTPEIEEALQALRLTLRDRLHVATTLGFGPRFLHSTGQ